MTNLTVILTETKMGRGVAEIEDDCRWHAKAPQKSNLTLLLIR